MFVHNIIALLFFEFLFNLLSPSSDADSRRGRDRPQAIPARLVHLLRRLAIVFSAAIEASTVSWYAF